MKMLDSCLTVLGCVFLLFLLALVGYMLLYPR